MVMALQSYACDSAMNKETEWCKQNQVLREDMEKYEKQYRERNCKCSKEEMAFLNCLVFENEKTYCKKMISSRTKKFGKRISRQIIGLLMIDYARKKER